MIRYRSRTLSWEASTSPDVEGYNVYFCPEADTLNFDSPSVNVGNITEVLIPDDIPELAGVDGVFKVMVAAYDDWGHEQSGQESIIPLDYVAPDAPGAPILS